LGHGSAKLRLFAGSIIVVPDLLDKYDAYAVLYEQVLAVQTGDLVMTRPTLRHCEEWRMLNRGVLDTQPVEHREQVADRQR
jgi:hypothetical protein